MPNCRQCGSRLSKFDKDMCPVCGCKNPFEGVENLTMDITQEIKSIDPKEINNYERKSKKKALIYSLALGFTGAPLFYLGFIKYGLIFTISALLFNVGLFLLLFFLTSLPIYAPILIVIGVYLLCHIGLAIWLLASKDLKDARGDYLN